LAAQGIKDRARYRPGGADRPVLAAKRVVAVGGAIVVGAGGANICGHAETGADGLAVGQTGEVEVLIGADGLPSRVDERARQCRDVAGGNAFGAIGRSIGSQVRRSVDGKALAVVPVGGVGCRAIFAADLSGTSGTGDDERGARCR